MFSKLLFHANPEAPLGQRLRVIAAAAIKKGEVLLREEPYMAVHTVNCADNMPPCVVHSKATFYEQVPLDEAILARLKSEPVKLSTYAAMCGAQDFFNGDDDDDDESGGSSGNSSSGGGSSSSDGSGGSGSGNRALEFVRTALIRNVTPGIEVCYGAALYKQVVYFNHACNGGARLFFSTQQRAVVVALRDMTQGEEVCLQYVPFLRGDCAAFHSREALTLDFKCDCEMCEKIENGDENLKKSFASPPPTPPTPPPKLSLYTFQMPRLQTIMDAATATADNHVGLECKIVNRCVRQLMITVQNLGYYESNYKVAQLMMRQKRAWKAFVQHAPGPLLVHLGLNLARCALLACKGGPAGESPTVRQTQKFSTLNAFWQQWNAVLSTADHGPDAPLEFRYGVLLHTLLAKFFKLALGKKSQDFFKVFRTLLNHMSNELYVDEKDEIMHLLCFHLDLLGWVDVIGFIEKFLSDYDDKK